MKSRTNANQATRFLCAMGLTLGVNGCSHGGPADQDPSNPGAAGTISTSYFDQIAQSQGTNLSFNSTASSKPSSQPFYQCTRNFYVATSGDDSATGVSDRAAWKTIQHALSQNLGAGDCVNVSPGTYNETIDFSNSHGNADSVSGYVVLRSIVKYGAKIVGPATTYSAVSMSNYSIVDGFDIKADEGHGIQTDYAHHTKILNNLVHDCGGSGISGQQGDYFYAEGNLVRGNSATNAYHTSGISYFVASKFDSNAGFHIILRNNVSHSNIEITPPNPTDGNGIIMDHLNDNNYQQEVLIENNLSYDNGGKGIHLLYSDMVTVRNNVAYKNNRDNRNTGTWRGELSNNMSSNNLWTGNIGVTDPQVNPNNTAIGSTTCCSVTSTGVRWLNNTTFDGTPGSPSVAVDAPTVVSAADGNRLGVDPHFVIPSGL